MAAARSTTFKLFTLTVIFICLIGNCKSNQEEIKEEIDETYINYYLKAKRAFEERDWPALYDYVSTSIHEYEKVKGVKIFCYRQCKKQKEFEDLTTKESKLILNLIQISQCIRSCLFKRLKQTPSNYEVDKAFKLLEPYEYLLAAAFEVI